MWKISVFLSVTLVAFANAAVSENRKLMRKLFIFYLI